MHLIVPFAGPLSESGRAALRSLALPVLRDLLALLPQQERDDGEAWSFSPPHERALARALGFAGGDGCLPWAAWHAAADGLAGDDLAWGELTPAHWHLGTDQVSLLDPEALLLSAADARELFDAVQGLFTSEGFSVSYGAPLRWYVAHESLAALRTASPDRVIGRSVDRWLVEEQGSDPARRLLRRLQNEVQMLLHTHPVNARREAQGLLTVNSVWLSGCGVAQTPAGSASVDDRLRRAALAEDWAAWVTAWETLDQGPLAELLAAQRAGQPVQLTLCGERAALTLAAGGGIWTTLRARLLRPAPAAVLESL